MAALPILRAERHGLVRWQCALHSLLEPQEVGVMSVEPAAQFLSSLMGVSAEDASGILAARRQRAAERFAITDAGRIALTHEMATKPIDHFRERQRINGALTIAEQAAWIRQRHEDIDSSSAQPHRFRSAE